MNFKLREIFIWLLSFAAVLAVFLLVTHNSQKIQIGKGPNYQDPNGISDSNTPSKIGQLGDVGVGPVDIARFTDLDPDTKEVVREFGFEKLLHKNQPAKPISTTLIP